MSVRRLEALTALFALGFVAACGVSSGVTTADATADALRARDAGHDARRPDAGRDAVSAPFDAGVDAPTDAPLATVALVRLANWSPDAPGIDFCISPHGSLAWGSPVLLARLGPGSLGNLVINDAELSKDAGKPPVPDAGRDARVDAKESDAAPDAGVDTGVRFLRMSPYVALTPGDYDVRVVTAGSTDCSAPLLPEIDDLPALVAGAVDTLAAVGDTVDEGTDPGLSLAFLPDDTSVAASSAALRFVNAVPSVIEVTLASGTIATATVTPYLSAVQFGGAGVDTDAGPLDANNYLSTAPITDQVWSLINANGGVTTLVTVQGAGVALGQLATVVAVGGESGPGQNDIGVLLCTDQPPIVAGETASCTLLQTAALPVCGGGC